MLASRSRLWLAAIVSVVLLGGVLTLSSRARFQAQTAAVVAIRYALAPSLPASHRSDASMVIVTALVLPTHAGAHRHDVAAYLLSVERIMALVPYPIVFYGSPELELDVRRWRGARAIEFRPVLDVFDVLPIKALGGLDWAVHQAELDETWTDLAPTTYAAWTAKTYWMSEVGQRHPNSLLAWVDAGSLQDHSVYTLVYPLWDLALYADRAEAALRDSPADTMLVFQVTGDGWLQAGSAVGSAKAWRWFNEAALDAVRAHTDLELHAGREEAIWSYVQRRNRHRVAVVKADEATSGCHPDVWKRWAQWATRESCVIPIEAPLEV